MKFNRLLISHIVPIAIAPMHHGVNYCRSQRRGFDAQCDRGEDNVVAEEIFEVDLRLLGVLGLLRLAVITLGSHSVGRGLMRARQCISE